MTGKIILTCGHEDKVRPNGFPLTTKDYDMYEDGGYGKVITYSHVCLKCYIEHLELYPWSVIFDPWEKEEWFKNGKT